MRDPADFTLTFFLPPDFDGCVGPDGTHRPSYAGCALELVTFADRSYMVTVRGPSRTAVFEQARRFLKVTFKDSGPLTIDAVLYTPASIPTAAGVSREDLGRIRRHVGGKVVPFRTTDVQGIFQRGGTDGIVIIIGADVGFAFTRMPVDVGEQQTVNHETPAPSHKPAAG